MNCLKLVAITCTLSDTNLSTLDIQLVRTEIITPSDSATACQETPKSVEFALIIYEGVSKQSISNSFPVCTFVYHYMYLRHTWMITASRMLAGVGNTSGCRGIRFFHCEKNKTTSLNLKMKSLVESCVSSSRWRPSTP